MESASTSGTEAPMPAHIPAAIDTVAPKWRPSGSDMYNWSGCLTRHIEAQSCAPTKEEAGATAAETQCVHRPISHKVIYDLQWQLLECGEVTNRHCMLITRCSCRFGNIYTQQLPEPFHSCGGGTPLREQRSALNPRNGSSGPLCLKKHTLRVCIPRGLLRLESQTNSVHKIQKIIYSASVRMGKNNLYKARHELDFSCHCHGICTGADTTASRTSRNCKAVRVGRLDCIFRVHLPIPFRSFCARSLLTDCGTSTNLRSGDGAIPRASTAISRKYNSKKEITSGNL